MWRIHSSIEHFRAMGAYIFSNIGHRGICSPDTGSVSAMLCLCSWMVEIFWRTRFQRVLQSDFSFLQKLSISDFCYYVFVLFTTDNILSFHSPGLIRPPVLFSVHSLSLSGLVRVRSALLYSGEKAALSA